MNDIYDVFLSYHGGQLDGPSSSYRKAEELKSFLETRNLKVFLCKAGNPADFYDAISEGILGSRHFILVACDAKMLEQSRWVHDEIKQFDGLRKNGAKNKGMIGAFIFGKLTPADLWNYNPVFSTIDITFGDNGFESLYGQIAASDGIKENGDKTIRMAKPLTSVKFFDLTNFEVERQLASCINSREDTSERAYWMSYAKELFGFYNVLTIFDYIKCLSESTNVLIVRLYRHYILNYMVKISEIKPIGDLDYMILVADDDSGGGDVIVDFRNRQCMECDKDRCLMYENGTVHISSNQSTSSLERVTVSLGDCKFEQMLISPQEGDEDLPVLSFGCDGKGGRQENAFVNIQRPEFLSFIIHSITDVFIRERWIDKDSAEYFDCVFTEPFDQKTVMAEFDKLYRKLIEDECGVVAQYGEYKRTGTFGNGGRGNRYSAIVGKIKNFYLHQDQNSLSDAIALLQMERKAELQRGSHYKQQAILLIIAELVMNTMYSCENDQATLNGLIGELRNSRNREVIPDYANQLYTMTLSIQKEMVFSGMYSGIADTLPAALNVMLSDMSRQIELLKDLHDSREVILSQLFLLHRQRAVIWEHLGDSTSDYGKRIHYYQSWKDDTLAAITYGKQYPSDQEILGCAYLNYASSLNRLAGTLDTEGMQKNYAECLSTLQLARETLKGNSAGRYIGYVYLHRADCYSEMYDSGLYDNKTIVRAMKSEARQAISIFEKTQDLIGRGWSMRLLAKAIIHSDDEELKVLLVNGLNKLKAALAVDTKACVVKEISRCVQDFSKYLGMIEENMLSGEMEGLIKQIFSAELEAFVRIVRDVDLDFTDITPVQNSLKLIMDKLQE